MWIFPLFGLSLLASQSYVPPPPPSLPVVVSKEIANKGKRLFEESVWADGKLEIHNYLGTISCSSCHDGKNRLVPAKLAASFKNLRQKINEELSTRTGGTPLPLQDPAMEALVQYLIQKYQLHDYKLLK